MIIYANKFVFNPKSGRDQLMEEIAKWVGTRAKQSVSPVRLAEGIRELRLNDGSILTSRATRTKDKKVAFPYVFGARLRHPDSQVSGRMWVVEVGLRQQSDGRPIECSVLMKTEEISALVNNSPAVTRPNLVKQLIDKCSPVGQTPGLTVKRLSEENAIAFLSEVQREEREYPITLISCNRDGNYPVTSERLLSAVVGLSDVVEVPISVDTFAIEEIVGRQYIAFGGAINIIFPARKGDRERYCETIKLLPAEIAGLKSEGDKVESKVLAKITHRTNLPYSWQHISLERVNQAVLHQQMAEMLERANASDNSEELKEYIELLQLAGQESNDKDLEIDRLRNAYDEKDREAREHQAENESLKYALSGRHDGGYNQVGNVIDALEPLRESIAAVIKGNPSLQQALELIASLYGERIVVLETAFNSARESDRAGTQLGKKGLELLFKLANEYWQALADGKGDQHAKNAFGHKVYAQNEGPALSAEGKRRRTFTYKGKDFLMDKHLKHGAKESLAETLRIHFEWVAQERKCVIGHCGKHLDF